MLGRAAGAAAILLGVLLGAIEPSAAQQLNIFGAGVPQYAVDPDTNSVTLGLKFYSTRDGVINGIRFYRGASSNSGYVARLYRTDGTVLASKRVWSEPCGSMPCWEEVDFDSPISIGANTTYIAAYFVKGGHYASNDYGLATGASNGPLIAPASGSVGGNGVYRYASSVKFPNQTYRASNYWVDVSFTPNAATPPYLQMSFAPPSPSVSSEALLGTSVVAVNVSWSDGSPFTGTLSFASPYSNDAGRFGLVGNNIVVNLSLLGLENTMQNVTIQASQ